MSAGGAGGGGGGGGGGDAGGGGGAAAVDAALLSSIAALRERQQQYMQVRSCCGLGGCVGLGFGGEERPHVREARGVMKRVGLRPGASIP